MQRLEFLPVDIGTSFVDKHPRDIVLEIATNLGWQRAEDCFDPALCHELIPYKSVLIKKGEVILYVPSSGYAVACVPVTSCSGSNSVEDVARALVDRWEFQRVVASDKGHSALSELRELILALRQRLRKSDTTGFRLPETSPVFRYSLSVFQAYGLEDKAALHALLTPRTVGCGSDAQQPPHLNTLVNHIAQLSEDALPPAVESDGQYLASSWSTVVLWGTKPADRTSGNIQTIATLVEFRVQSSWYAADAVRSMATNIGKVYSSSHLGRQFSELALVFSQVAARSNKELGPNRPALATAVLHNIVETSGVDAEIEQTERAIETAQKRIIDATEQRNARSRTLLEVFGLLFASSSLAPLLWTPPLRAATFDHDVIPFLIWLGLTLTGVGFIWAQRR